MTRNLVTLLIVFFLPLNNVHADAIDVKKGDSAPFDGVLIDNATANELVKSKQELESLKIIRSSLEVIIDKQKMNSDIDAEKLKMMSVSLDSTTRALREARETSTIERIGYIGLGMAAVLFGGWAISRVR